MSTGTMTPVPDSAGTGAFLGIVPPLVRTHLSLARYARILGLNPVHFWGAFGQTIWQLDAGCDDVWPRHNWQRHDAASREEVSLLIKDAENEISRFLGYPVAPQWVEEEVHRYPRFYRRDYIDHGMHSVTGLFRSVDTNWQKVRRVGTRATTAISTGETVAYTDEDGDGFSETATITATTTLTDTREIKVYFAGTDADPRWEIRDPRSISIDSGVVTIKFDSWLLITPSLTASYPTPNGFDGVDIGDSTTNFVAEVDVYREYTDDTVNSAILYWEDEPSALSNNLFCSSCGGSGCSACSLSSQNGCLHVRDHEAGIVVPQPATYDAESGTWSQAAIAVCRAPDQVKIYYQAGNVSDEYSNGFTTDPLDEYWAQTIAMLATSRLERELCGCGNSVALANHWREDKAYTGDDTSYLVDFEELKNPFGTKIGELAAWHRVSSFMNRSFDAALI